MNRNGILAATVLVSSLAANATLAQTFTGNGGTSFGGPVGTGTLVVTETTPGTINFSFTSTAGAIGGDDLVIYVDSKTGGFGDTSLLTDTQDGGRTAVSGFNSQQNTRTLASFAPTFAADYAISVQPSFTGLFDLSTPANFGFVASGGVAGSGSGPITFSFTRAQLGLPTSGLATFKLEGSLISTSAYRSNETIGTSITVPGTLGDAPSAGFTGSQTFSTFGVVVVPEPTTLAALAGMGLVALRRRK